VKKATLLLGALPLFGAVFLLPPAAAHADGFIDFENGTDGAPIRSTIAGLQFTTTEGYDWIYGDWRTGDYNGPYPDGACYSNGNFFAYVLLHNSGNYWLIDDLSTDAGGVPATRPAVVVIPGLTGSKLRNDDSCQNRDYEVWPDLLNLLLAPNGSDPASACDQIYPDGVIRDISAGPLSLQFYGPMIDYLTQSGYDVRVFDYDWRLDLRVTADRTAPTIDVQLAGSMGPSGWYVGEVTATISATDAGSGVAAIAYSIDRGETVTSYGGPFAVQAQDVSYLIVQATDRAGNQAWEKVLVGPVKTFLPVSSHGGDQPAEPTWQAGAGLADRAVYGLSSAAATCNVLFAGADDGATWQPRNGGLGDLWIYALAVSPVNCEIVYAVTNEHGVWRTTNGGVSWQPSNNGLGNLTSRSIALAPGNPQRLFVGATSGVWRSDNGGDSWQERNTGLSNRHVRTLAIDPADAQRAVVGIDQGGGVYRTLDGGQNRTPLNDGLGNRSVKRIWLAGGACDRLHAGTISGAWYYQP
jgi:photosystem II stability/assembly factor-like uncharacterized protein